MTAKFSDIWKNSNIKKLYKEFRIHSARFTPPSNTPNKTKGKYPHMQPFNITGARTKRHNRNYITEALDRARRTK